MRFAVWLVLAAAVGLGGDDAWQRLHRPLHIAQIAAGAPCPTTAARLRNEPAPYGLRPLVGRGPVYPAFYADDPSDPARTVPSPADRVEGGWYFSKIVWQVSPRYRGRVLIRGRRVDGAGEFRFGDGPMPVRERRLPAGRGLFANGWKATGGYVRFPGEGCYAVQIDGTTFSRVVVFRLVARSR